MAHGKGNVANMLFLDFRPVTCSDDFTIRVGPASTLKRTSMFGLGD